MAESTLLIVRENSQQISELRESIGQQGAEFRESIGQQNVALQESIAEVVSMISGLAQQQAETDQRFNNLLEDARTDRKRIDQTLEDMRRDRAINENEHRAFRETFQTLLAEVVRNRGPLAE
ncbi:MAG: hypothetical protein HC812_00245 [Leptolyngbya sp. RL_3_1]|nr:hypothetical protein [Leptolyngbya sp. RL_3_1]